MQKWTLRKKVDTMSIKKGMKILDDLLPWIVEAYTVELMSMATIAALLKVSRQAIYKALKRAGIDTAKKGGIEVSCTACGKTVVKAHCYVRKTKHIFCDRNCYAAWLEVGNGRGPYIQHRQGMRLARSVAAKFVVLKDDISFIMRTGTVLIMTPEI